MEKTMLRNLFGSAVWSSLVLARVYGADFEVTTTNDAGFGSYRQAIEDSNDNPGPDRIIFNIPGDGVQTIQPVTPLPAFTEPIIVDGYTQPGAKPNTLSNAINAVLLIQLDGINAGGQWDVTGVRLRGGMSTVRGLIINRFSTAVWLDSSSNRVVGNFIGPDPSGLNALGNRGGFYLQSVGPGPFSFDNLFPSCCQVIGGTDPADRNLISGNGGYAFQIGEWYSPFRSLPPVIDSVVLGNFIGTDLTGLVRIPSSLSSTFTVRSAVNFTIGGLEPGAGNVIALGDRSVHVYIEATGTRILGNSFGVGADGHTPLGRTNSQFTISGGTNTVVEGNRVAFGFAGVSAYTISRNLIYSNTLFGIGGSRPDFPEFTPLAAGATLEMSGRFRGRSNDVFQLEFFANGAPHPSGYGEGEGYLGAITITTGSTGEGAFHTTLPNPAPLWPWISATATDPDGTTSSFALTRAVRSSGVLQIHTQPIGAVGRPGFNVTLRVEASGAWPIQYQWRRNGVDLPGATNALCTLTNLQPGQDGLFTVRLSNPLGALISDPATVELLVTPTFVRHPISQTVAPGEWVTLSAVVHEYATLPLNFGWRSNGVDIIASGPSMDRATYLTVRAGTSNATYGVLVTNAAVPGSVGVPSALAKVTIGADRDGDGLPDAYEIAHRLNPDNAADAQADPDEDGMSNAEEYLAGTEPQDPFSHLKLDAVSVSGGGTLLEFGAASNKTYSVQYREQLDASPWLVLTNFPAFTRNQTNRVVDPVPSRQRFYRLTTPRSP
jgi:hypothetical protein